MRVMKFGGSSVGTAERIQQVIRIVQGRAATVESVVVVVSAFGGVTDGLIAMSQRAASGDRSYSQELAALRDRHLAVATALGPRGDLPAILAHLGREFQDLADALQGISLIRELSKRTLDYIMSFGERLSAFIVASCAREALPGACYVDAREIIRTDRQFGAARVNLESSFANIRSRLGGTAAGAVVTGFIASTDQGETTTLGRGGSDYTAALVGAGVGADEIEIWTDVDGVMTADPRKVPQAFPIPRMTYMEALEMSHFGAKVIHPPTIAPALQRNIPLSIRNTFNPDAGGTVIVHESADHEHPIRGISSVDDVALFRVEGSGMVGVCGIASRLFGALAREGISLILISQGSSEHSICFAIAPQAATLAREAIELEFSLEMKAGIIDDIVVETDLAIVAIVGENMRRTPGIAGRLFGGLGRNGVNVNTIAQGSSEYNISLVVGKPDLSKALNAIHDEFFLSRTATLNLFLVGTGLIGTALLDQIRENLPRLRQDQGLDLRIMGVANSRSMRFSPDGIDPGEGKAIVDGSGEPADLRSFVSAMRRLNLNNSVFVDCTASEAVAGLYEEILESSIAIVTPNKRANSGSQAVYERLREVSRRRGGRFLYSTNVGAGLPILGTIAGMVQSGDRVLEVEAVLSGTLSFLFSEFMRGAAFSAVLGEAQRLGLTEPDPREDLNGQDVMRKLLIIVRECGYRMEPREVELEPLLPAECFDVDSVETFYRKLESHDGRFEELRETARREGKVLHVVATFAGGEARVALRTVGPEHTFHGLSRGDNIVRLTTDRYRASPLVIRGQGAGAQITAGHVLADIIRIGSH
ncbi:MAG: bifunctional aspartate kinase/homoserine dehydrogenase I [Candidatus Riflebacteria bacterium]|nr:bifunctional aspartate kinase/homoserine dehydrogenase I [Candidatus Riflebacteria bacterium]